MDLSYHRIHYSDAQLYAYLCAVIGQDITNVLWLDMPLVDGLTIIFQRRSVLAAGSHTTVVKLLPMVSN